MFLIQVGKFKMKSFRMWVVKIQGKIVSHVVENKYFSILASKTAGVSEIERLSLSVRFVRSNSSYEEFFSFVAIFFCSK